MQEQSASWSSYFNFFQAAAPNMETAQDGAPSKISFKINGKPYEVEGQYGPDFSLNEYLRNVAEVRGVKAMCHEGGCGACVVAVRAHMPDGSGKENIQTFSVNSCLVSLLSCHGWEILTAEGIGNRTIGYHEIQTRLASFNGTQCGYCTPGWVMNMYSLYESKNKKLTMTEIENSFASNICRCTGYRPIVDAFKSFATDTDERLKNKLADLEDLGFFKACGVKCSKKCEHKDGKHECERMKTINEGNVTGKTTEISQEKSDNKMIVIDCGTHTWFKAYSLDDVFKTIGRGNNYKLVAGNTGQGVYHVTDYPQNVIDIFNVAEIKGHSFDENLILGAGMPLTEMMELFQSLPSSHENFLYLRQFHEHMDLVAHIPVRNIGTIGGNLFMKHVNNDFQSDLFLLFETVGGNITIADGVKSTKVISLPEFLKTDMKGKIIVNILLPPLSAHHRIKTYKIMPRSQNAHAVVNAGLHFKLKPNTDIVEEATIVYGSISPTFIHAAKTEALLVGKDLFTDETLQMALKSLSAEITPEEAPPEPSAAYRKMLALALYYKGIIYLCPEKKLNPIYRSGGEAIKRHTSQGNQTFDTDKSVWPLNKPIPKLEALVQCSGEATFANDLPNQGNEVFGAFVTADITAGSVITGFDASEALKIPGVTAFYTVKDIPGNNSFTPTVIPFFIDEEEVLCKGTVLYYGQPAGIIVADREKTANKAARAVKINYKVNAQKPLIAITDVLKSPQKAKRLKTEKIVEPTDKGGEVNCIVNGELNMDTQFHFAMEPHTTIVVPAEDGLDVYAATQSVDNTTVAVAQCLKLPVHSVNVMVRRVGGAYGGKISRSTQVSCAAALVAHLQGKTCRFIVPLQTCTKSMGKRVPTYCNFEVGVNSEGQIQYLNNKYYQDNGCSPNETLGVITLNHFRNCYDSRRWHIETYSVATDTPGNTWCRAPASTEGVAMIEHIMERIAYNLGKDPLQVRMLNMKIGDNPIPDLINQLKTDSNYDSRSEEIKKFNDNNRWRKRSLKLIPMTYDLFYFGPYNAMVSIFQSDATVMVTHGGVEMGQGINTKVAQICAHMLDIPLEKISIKPTRNLTSPNSVTTGGSIGSELVGFAAMKACEIILKRLEPIRQKLDKPTWETVVRKAYEAGIDLQASYMYSHNDGVKPYDVYGVCALEVEVDILTGNHDVRRVDLLEDTGRSLSPEIDVGQIEGAFVMGLGYWTSEKIMYDSKDGKMLTDRTWTYKPPGIKDIPADFRVYFRRNYTNNNGVLQSKATGEPSFCMAVVITHAFREAVRAARLHAGLQDQWVDIQHPCNVENIFMAVEHKIEHFKLK